MILYIIGVKVMCVWVYRVDEFVISSWVIIIFVFRWWCVLYYEVVLNELDV